MDRCHRQVQVEALGSTFTSLASQSRSLTLHHVATRDTKLGRAEARGAMLTLIDQ
jgi:hypothetical protein